MAFGLWVDLTDPKVEGTYSEVEVFGLETEENFGEVEEYGVLDSTDLVVGMDLLDF